MVDTRAIAGAIRQAVAIVVIGVALGLVANAAAPWGIPWVAEPTLVESVPDSVLFARPPASLPTDTPTNDRPGIALRTITLRQAKILFDGKAAVFVDARPPYEYSDGHIPDAVLIPYEEIEYYEAAIERLPRDSAIVVYCAGQSCDLSVHLAEELAERGFWNVRVFFGGWVEWERAGYPTSR